MNELFAVFYESDLLYHEVFSTILWQTASYSKLGIIMLGSPLIALMSFYLFVTYPRCKAGHWLIAFLVGIAISGILTHNTLTSELAVQIYDGVEGINTFILDLTIANIGYSTLFALFFSIIPQFIIPNKPQSHLPILLKKIN